MASDFSPADFDGPDLTIAGFRLWIHGREFPEASDAFDGNWVRATAQCAAPGARVCVHGAILMVSDMERFQHQCGELFAGKSAAATLDAYEPNLKVSLERIDRLGHLRARIELTPDHLSQSHLMDFEIDESYLPEIDKSCTAILKEYPVRG